MDTSITEPTPMSFLRRSATVFADDTAAVHSENTWTYRELASQVEQRARMLRAAGVRQGDRVAYLMANVPEMMAAHFAVPLAGQSRPGPGARHEEPTSAHRHRPDANPFTYFEHTRLLQAAIVNTPARAARRRAKWHLS